MDLLVSNCARHAHGVGLDRLWGSYRRARPARPFLYSSEWKADSRKLRKVAVDPLK